MLTRRVIVCLDVRGARVVKGVNFVGLRDVGIQSRWPLITRPKVLTKSRFSTFPRARMSARRCLDVATRTAERLFIPLTIGGGIRSVDDVSRVLRAGADKISLNSSAVARPELLTEAADKFGAQCVVASIDAKLDSHGVWRVWTKGGREQTSLEAVSWAQRCVELGAGEILLTSIDRDGARNGYDLPLTRAVADAVPVPVIASGGAGTPQHLVDAIHDGGADAVLVAGILHDGVTTVRALKEQMIAAGLSVRETGAQHA